MHALWCFYPILCDYSVCVFLCAVWVIVLDIVGELLVICCCSIITSGHGVSPKVLNTFFFFFAISANFAHPVSLQLSLTPF